MSIRKQAQDWLNSQPLMALQAQYEAALARNDLWQLADFRDADASLQPDIRREIRSRSRYEYANNPLAFRVANVYVDDVVGKDGPQLQVNTGHSATDRLIEGHWATWWEHTRQLSKFRVAVLSETNDGESVALRIMSRRIRRLVQTDILALESDRLASLGLADTHLSTNIDGVHVDRYTLEPIAYDILDQHPGHEFLDQPAAGEGRTVPVNGVLHAFESSRPEQHRGIPRNVSVLPLTGLFRKFLEAKVSKAQLQAAIAFAIKSIASPGDDDDGGGEGDGNTAKDSTLWQSITLPARQGLGIMFPDGYEPVQFKTDGDAQDIDAFHQVIALLYAGCFSMPLGRAIGRYQSGAYGSIRGELKPYQNRIDAVRSQVWEPLYLTPLFGWWWEEFSLTTRWRDHRDTLRNQQLLISDSISWQWAEAELIVDPSREHEANKKQLASGTILRSQLVRARDLDIQDKRAAQEFGFGEDEAAVKAYRQWIAQSTGGGTLPGQQDAKNGDAAAAAKSATPAAGKTDKVEAELHLQGCGGCPTCKACNTAKPLPEAERGNLLEELLSRSISEERFALLLTSLDHASQGAQPTREARRLGQALQRGAKLAQLRPLVAAVMDHLDLDAELHLQANCGTGAGGFKPGNKCQRGGGGGSGASGTRKRSPRGKTAEEKQAEANRKRALAGQVWFGVIAVNTALALLGWNNVFKQVAVRKFVKLSLEWVASQLDAAGGENQAELRSLLELLANPDAPRKQAVLAARRIIEIGQELGLGILDAELNLQADCGTGAGGFKPGNSCAKGRGSSRGGALANVDIGRNTRFSAVTVEKLHVDLGDVGKIAAGAAATLGLLALRMTGLDKKLLNRAIDVLDGPHFQVKLPLKGEQQFSRLAKAKEGGIATRVVSKSLESAKFDRALTVDIQSGWSQALGNMSPTARRAIDANVSKVNLFGSPRQLTEAVEKFEKGDYPLGTQLGGAYHPRTKQLWLAGNLGGGDRTTAAIFAHELTHALDGGRSRSDAWKNAWQGELSAGQLSQYAGTNQAEGFAEFGRVLFSGEYDTRAVRTQFPQSYQVFAEQGWVKNVKPGRLQGELALRAGQFSTDVFEPLASPSRNALLADRLKLSKPTGE